MPNAISSRAETSAPLQPDELLHTAAVIEKRNALGVDEREHFQKQL